MRKAYKILTLVGLGLVVAQAFADSSIRLTAFPVVGVVADGRSTVTLTAEIRDSNGRAVADGTRVTWDCPGATFRESVTATIGGFARGVMIAGTTPGEANVTVTSLSGDCSPTTIKYLFAASRDDLTSAKEYVEVVSNGYLQYTPGQDDQRILGAAAPNNGVTLRYRDITVTADDLQYSLNDYVVRARKATLRMGGLTKTFDQLFLRLHQHSGYGIATVKSKRSNSIVSQGIGFAFVNQDDSGRVSPSKEFDRFGPVGFNRTEVFPVDAAPPNFFAFTDQGHSPSSVSAKKAIVFPRRMIQFQKAEIYIAGSRVLKIPLYEYDLTQTSPLVTEQMLAVSDSQVQVNYPYIISMKPGQTALVRFRTGDEYGRGFSTDHGAFLDYELSWDRGDEMQGGLTFSGIGRNDWAVGINQYLQLDPKTTLSAQVLTPSGQSFFGTANASHQFEGFSASLNGDASRTLQGIQYTTSDYSATVAKDPIKVGALPMRLTYELTATGSSNQLINESQHGEGARLRTQSLPLVLDSNTTLVASFTSSYLVGNNELHGIQYLGTASFSHKISSSSSAIFTYNFTRDGFNERAVGEHQVTSQFFVNRGNTNFSILGSKSLDIQRDTVFGDLSYRLNKLWRLRSSYTLDNYLNTTYRDYSFSFGYKLGWREVGLIWTQRTQRIGLQILGATFN